MHKWGLLRRFVKSRIWFGGEPLLAKDVIFDIAEHAYALSKSYGFSLIGGFTTNAYLLDIELARKLAEINHVSYQITIDGDEDEHNRTRVLANGRPTFKRIINNIISMKDSNIPLNVTLRLHIHKGNIQSIKDIHKKLSSLIKDDRRFSFFFHKVSDLGGNPQTQVMDDSDYEEVVKSIISVDGNQNISSEITTSGYICYASKPNSIVIRSNGRVNKCTVALGDKSNDVGYLSDNGDLILSQEKLGRWFAGYSDLDSNTLSCPFGSIKANESHVG